MSSDVGIQRKRKIVFYYVKYQFLASVCANIIVLAQGCAIGWMSPALLVLLSEDTPLESGRLTLEEASWIGSLFPLGSAIGLILFGVFSLYIGNKRSILICALPITIFWLTVLFAKNAWHLSVGRFTTGLSGGALICIQLFVADIADERIRGALSSLLTLNLNIGILIGYISGSYLQWFNRCFLLMIFPIIFFIVFSFMPESPQHLLKINQLEKAEQSLRFYRNRKVGSESEMEFQKEFEKFKEIAEQIDRQEKVKLKDFLTPTSLRAMLIGPTLMAVSQFSGTFTLVSYSSFIFSESGSNLLLHPNVSSIILGSLQIAGTICTYFLIDKVGRRVLLTISSGGAAIGLCVIGIYYYLSKLGVDVSQFNWIPVVTLPFVIYISSIGIIPVPYVIISEVLPQKIKRIGGPICMSSVGFYAFIMVKMFPTLMDTIDLSGCMFLFAFVNVLGIVFTKFIVRETNGLNLNVLESRYKIAENQKELEQNELYITKI